MFQGWLLKSAQNMLQTERQVIASKRHPKKTQKKHTYPGSLLTPILFLLFLVLTVAPPSFWDC